MFMTDSEKNMADLKAMQPLEAAIQTQKEYNALAEEMKVVSKRREFARERLIADLESRGRDREGNSDGKVVLIRKTYNKVTDFDALRDYVYELGEPLSLYMEEVFIKGNKRQGIEDPLDRLVERAFKESLNSNKHIKECMPPGLEVATSTQIRVTLAKPGKEIVDFGTDSKYPDLDAALEEK